MATGLKSRIIYRKKTKETSATDYWAGDYELLVKAKSIPSPFGDPNMVDTSSLEDLVELQERGRASANTMDIVSGFLKDNKDKLIELENELLDIVILYGNDGKGAEGVCAFLGTIAFRPDEATDDHLTCTTTVFQKTVPKFIDDKYSVSVVEDDFGYPTSITLTKTV